MNFTKMHGLGNDFIILEDAEFAKTDLNHAELAKRMCDRKFGIGADGLIFITEPSGSADIGWRIFNSDGSEPEMCGNGIRCFAKYVYDKGLVDKKKFSVSTLAGEIVPEILDNGQVRVDMGEPILEPEKIPVKINTPAPVINYPLEINGQTLHITPVSMGNPHCIIFTEGNSEAQAKSLGEAIEKHSLFPEKTNVEFVKILSNEKIKVDVWERGCGITLACGTGACASVVASVLNNHTKNIVEVELPGGKLGIEWNRETNKIFMTGEAAYVFDGNYFI